MPLTEFQREVMAVISKNRSPESHFAGGIVFNADKDSSRYSKDFDIFHDAQESVVRSSEKDAAALREAGFEVVTKYPWQDEDTFRKAEVRKTGTESRVEIDWAADSACRFFPAEADPLFGWRLHLFDFATNKALALAARSVTRDYIDIVGLGEVYPLHATVWAACGKDEGFSPRDLLEWMRRFAKISPDQVQKIQARNLDVRDLKRRWQEMSYRAEEEINRVADANPDLPIGVAFLDEGGNPGWIGDDPSLRIHHPTVGGCWPRFPDADRW